MSNRRCPNCGEEYSDTYRTCPFCEEEEAIKRGHPLRRRGGRRAEKRKPSNGGAGGVMLLLCAVIIIGVLGYVVFGDDVADAVGIRTDPEPAPSGTQVDPPTEPGDLNGTPADPTPDDTPPVDPAVTDPDPDIPDEPPEQPTEPVPLALNQTNITIRVGDKGRLDYIGGTGEVTWTSSNENIATVEGGTITGMAGGTVTITAASGEETATCQVKVEGEAWVNPNASSYKLSKTDFTLRSGENSWQLKIKRDNGSWEILGAADGVTWASANTSVATVSDTGLVTRAGKGMTTVTATVDGVTMECIVRMS